MSCRPFCCDTAAIFDFSCTYGDYYFWEEWAHWVVSFPTHWSLLKEFWPLDGRRRNELAHENKGPYGFLVCGSSNAHVQSPVGAADIRFCHKLPQGPYYMSVSSKDWLDCAYAQARLSLCLSPLYKYPVLMCWFELTPCLVVNLGLISMFLSRYGTFLTYLFLFTFTGLFSEFVQWRS